MILIFIFSATIAKAELVELPFEGMDQLSSIDEVKEVIFGQLAAAFNLQIQQFKIDNYLDSSFAHKIFNHPVHIVEDEKFSPSALIPFCQFGDNVTIMGTKVEHFKVPVCNDFQAKILNDQLCYEVNPNKYKEWLTPDEFKDGVKKGIEFYVDTNDDRQTSSRNESFLIYLDTLGNVCTF